MNIEDAMKAKALELYGSDDLSKLAPGLLEWLEKEVGGDNG
ncbi:hypothetical protein SEA_A3WALLY_237 [Microbacterium phage A3Wally]|nr:hypothetical protein SEA_A3WALLY_237 [Microbacterium phage A3Wally]